MANTLSKLEHLRERCTDVAKEFLAQIEQHPEFPKVVEIVSKLDGGISHADIVDAFIQVAKKRARLRGKNFVLLGITSWLALAETG